MQSLNLSVATAGFGLPIRESLRRASAMGAKGVVFDARYEIKGEEFTESARRQLLHLLSELGLQLVGFHYPIRRPITDPVDVDRRLEALRKALNLAALFQCRLLTFRFGALPLADDAEGNLYFQQILEDLAAHGNRVGVIPTLISGGEAPPRMKELLEKISSGFIGIDCDPTQHLGRKNQVSAMLRLLHDRITHVQVKDALRDLDGQTREVAVGRGEVDWTELIPTLHEIEYRGWLTVNRASGDDCLGDSARAIEYVRNLFLET